MKKCILYLLLTVIVFCKTYGQQKIGLQSLIPPAPNAAELGKYGTYQVGTSTGTPEINFPLYEITSGNLKLPISLSYHASGVQVNQKSTDVGLCWSVMAGGTISRTIYGAADDGTYGYFNYSPPTYASLFNTTNYYTMVGYTNSAYDLEPDLFAYNVGGKSGKFIFNRSQNFVTIPFDPIVINKLVAGTTTYFQIIDDSGTIYNFRETGNTVSDFAILRNNITSWYLTTMISADYTDTISFEYESFHYDDPMDQQVFPIGKKTTMTGGSTSEAFVYGEPYYAGGTQTITSINPYNEPLIKKIKFSNGYVQFNRNTLRKDTSPQVNMLDEILVYDNYNTVIKKIIFNHGYFTSTPFTDAWAFYRLKLTGFIESSGDASIQKKYSFKYDSATSIPKYGSYNIDYWGYSNGASNNGLIPTTTVTPGEINGVSFINGESYNNGFTNFTESWSVGNANREPSRLYMKAGVLNKIIYPTGGYTTFDFEPHKYLSDEYKQVNIPNKGGTTAGISKFTKSQGTFLFSYPANPANASVNPSVKYVPLNLVFAPSNMGNSEMGETQLVTLTNVTTGSIIKTWKHEGDLTLTYPVNEVLTLFSGYSYEIKQEIYGSSAVTITSSISWQENTSEHLIKIGGGLRVKSIKSYDSDGVLGFKETYNYGKSESGLGTKLFDERNFYRNYEDVVSHYFRLYGHACVTASGHETYWVRNFMGISKYNTLNYQGSPFLYSEITKYLGDSLSNIGKTVYNYRIIADPPVYPDEFINSGNYGSISSAWNQAELLKEKTYKNQGGLYTPVTNNFYAYGQYNISIESGILLRQYKQFVQLEPCPTDPTGPFPNSPKYGQGFFVLYEYPIKTGISKKTKSTHTTYNPDTPSDSVSVVTNYKYQNAANRFLTETSVTGSDGRLNITRVKYPQDMTGAVPAAMAAKNILTPQLEEKTFTSTDGVETLQSTMQINYKQIGNLIVRDNILASTGSLTPETRVLFNQYDLSGNILEQQKVSDEKQSYVWGYSGTLPIAEVKNAAVAEIAYTSFERKAPGSWTINSNNRLTNSAFTGQQSYSLANGSISKSGLSNTKTFVVSLWALPGASVSINGSLTTPTASANGWNYHEKILSSITSITVSGTGTIDEVRLHPLGSLMTTYTHDPLIGIRSVTDPNQNTVYYVYDTLGRLKWIKDLNGHIVKSYEYHYKGY